MGNQISDVLNAVQLTTGLESSYNSKNAIDILNSLTQLSAGFASRKRGVRSCIPTTRSVNLSVGKSPSHSTARRFASRHLAWGSARGYPFFRFRSGGMAGVVGAGLFAV